MTNTKNNIIGWTKFDGYIQFCPKCQAPIALMTEESGHHLHLDFDGRERHICLRNEE